MSFVLLDTVGLLALWNRNDQWHAAAKGAFVDLVADRCRFLTTTFVLLECGNAATRRPFRPEVNALREQLEADKLLVSPTREDWHAAWEAYTRSEGNQAGIVDCVSFVVMRRLRIEQAFTNDDHFRAAGFATLF